MADPLATCHPDFPQRVAAATRDARLVAAMDRATRRQDDGRKRLMSELHDPLAVRELAARIKDHTLANLDHYLQQLVENVRRAGGTVHFAFTREQARRIICRIARDAGAKRVVKTKSMTTEEIELNRALQAAGCQVTETDLGEYIAQLDGDRPSHIVAPIVHKTTQDISRLFADKLGIAYTEDPTALTKAARRVLRARFREADMAVTGANFAVAETGTIVTVTNEGNGRYCISRPRVLVTLMGLEKVIPTMQDLAVFLKLLARSATGQRMTIYTNLTTGPRRRGDPDGPEQFHLVIVDCGRLDILASEYHQVLRCIRCGACLNACPVYRKIGGHAYEAVYPGPIGKLITPMLQDLETYKHLPQASSLCGACFEACPVRIDIPQLLVRMRYELLKRGYMPLGQRLGMKLWKWAMRSERRYRWAVRFGRGFLNAKAVEGWCRSLPGPARQWTSHRDFPAMAEKSFHELWQEGGLE